MSDNIFFAENQKQIELLTDPFGLTVLAHLDANKPKTPKEISSETGEDLNLVREYLEKMNKAEMLLTKEINDICSYLKKADYYRFSYKMLSDIPDKFENHQIFGLLYALQGDFYDFLNEASKFKNIDSALAAAGYPPIEESLSLVLERIYVTPEELKELNQKLKEVIKEYTEKPKENNDDYLTLDLNFFTKPNLPEFKNNLNKN